MLGCRIEYLQATKRLAEIAHAPAGTPEAQEREELKRLFRAFDKDIAIIKANTSARKRKL